MPAPVIITVGGSGPYDPAANTDVLTLPFAHNRIVYVEQRDIGPLTSSEILRSIVDDTVFTLQGGLKFNLDDIYWIHDVGESYSTTGSGSYTNGFNFSKVMNTMFARVGWSQNVSSPVLNSTNLLSKGGRYFNDGSFHALVTLSNIKAVMEDATANDANFNAYIESLQRANIIRSLNGVFSEPEYISQSLIYDSRRWNDTPLPNSGKFVGVRLRPPNKIGLATQIDSVSLYFDSDVTFNLYLFNDKKKEPIRTISVTATANTQTVVSLNDVILNYVGDSNHSGNFYLGYFQDDLGAAKAIRENDIESRCVIFGAEMFETRKTGTEAFDRLNVSYTYNPYGLNPFISVWRDHTWQICAKASLFDNLFGLQMAAAVVEQSLFTQRSNTEERGLNDQMKTFMGALSLEGVVPVSDSPQTTGLKKMIAQEVQRMKLSFFPKGQPQSINLC